MLGVEGKKVHILRRRSKYESGKKVVNLLLIAEREQRYYMAIKSLSRLLISNNTKHKHKQHVCLNCLQGFPTKISRDNHFKYCKDNKTVRIEMPKEGSLVKFQDGQYEFKVPFIMYADFKAILKQIEGPQPNPERPCTKVIKWHILSGFCVNSQFAYGKVKNPSIIEDYSNQQYELLIRKRVYPYEYITT